MIVGIIGSGGREHAICSKIKESPKISKIFCIPGNAGTKKLRKILILKSMISNLSKIFVLKAKLIF